MGKEKKAPKKVKAPKKGFGLFGAAARPLGSPTDRIEAALDKAGVGKKKRK